MQNCETLVHAGFVVTQNDNRDVIADAGLAIQRGRIQEVAPWAEMQSYLSGAKLLDLSSCLVLPGLINSHAHAAMTFLRGLADDQPLMTWLQETVFPAEARLTPEITRLGSLLGHAGMLATGTTACVDMYLFENSVLEAAEISGIRCLGGEAVFQFPSASCADYRQALRITRELSEKYADHERISIAVNPHSVYTTTEDILRDCRGLAIEFNLPLHIHLAETASETRECRKLHHKRPVAWCESLGLFDARVIAAHLVDITPEEAELLAANRVCGVHNPSSNMKLASGAAPVTQMLAAGMDIGLGTDGPASNNQLNMFTEMGRAALLQKLVNRDPASLPAQATLDLATRGGAAAFGNPRLGRLETGSAADLIALDLKSPNLQPCLNPVSQAVYAASGHEVCLTMIGGETVYRDGKFTRFDYPALLSEIRKLRDFVAKGK